MRDGPYAGCLILLLRKTKTGQPDSDKVILSNPRVVQWMHRFVAVRKADQLFAVKSVEINQLLLAAARSFGYAEVRFTSHSLRRGAATELALQGWGLASIMQAGRWASERSCKLYIMKGEVMLLRLQARIATADQARIRLPVPMGDSVPSTIVSMG